MAKTRYKLENINDLNILDNRYKQILSLRMGVGDYDRPYTFKEITYIIPKLTNQGKPWLTRERIRQMEAKALRILIKSGCKIIEIE